MTLREVWTRGATEDSRSIRIRVFCEEQGFREEFDALDDCADTLVLYDGDTPVATGRMYPHNGAYFLGRIAVCREQRGTGLGTAVVRALEARAEALGAVTVRLNAQCRARGFYESLGYVADGEFYYEEDCLHVPMAKTLG